MLYQINDVTVTVGGAKILDHIHFEIHGTEKIAVVGRNGAGKTTLLKLICGDLTPDRDDRRQHPGIIAARALTTGILRQDVFKDKSLVLEEYLHSLFGRENSFLPEMYAFERDFDRMFTRLGFSAEDKNKKLEEFSGGEQTKIGLIFLFLQKPDILLLDEPTNHLDMGSLRWLEEQIRNYEKAVVMVSHDRFFLDQTAQVTYELTRGQFVRYVGNYTEYRKQKRKNIEIQNKAYERWQTEVNRQNELIRRFKNKPKKAAFARSRKKMVERMEKVSRPEPEESHIFTGEILPLNRGSKWVFQCEHLKIGYDRPLLELTWRLRRGQKVGIVGPNGAGKTTFLKTVVGKILPMEGKCDIGNEISIGYFDQHSANISSEKTVAGHFHDLFPALTQKEVYQTLGAFLLGGERASARVKDLSGGERARLVLCEILQSRPNFLVLDEPTNHMDIPAKETLESAFSAYKGTILFVSHDRYFISQVADALLIFEDGEASFYPFSYEHYARRKYEDSGDGQTLRARMDAQEAAMIQEFRDVPKAERHMETVNTEEAYMDWQLRLAREQMEQCRAKTQQLWRQLEIQSVEQWKKFGSGRNWEQAGDEKEAYEEALLKWQEACEQWYEIYCQYEDCREELYGKDSDTTESGIYY